MWDVGVVEGMREGDQKRMHTVRRPCDFRRSLIT